MRDLKIGFNAVDVFRPIRPSGPSFDVSFCASSTPVSVDSPKASQRSRDLGARDLHAAGRRSRYRSWPSARRWSVIGSRGEVAFWLVSGGIVQRMDRAYLSEANSGEIRLIYV